MALNPGDIAFVQYNADNTDNFAFVNLVTIPAGEVILFTDNGWLNTNAFRTGEGIITWTAPAGGVTAGTVITIDTTPSATAGTVTESLNLDFSASGDQIIAFQGSLASPTPIAALNNDGSSVFQTTAADTNTSALPLGLVIGTSAVAIAEIDNARYTGITTGDKATLQAALFNPANWAGDDATNQTFAGAFTSDNDSVTPSTAKISTIQGTGTAATAGTFTIEGIVVGDFQGTGQLGGFYLQEEDTDADGNPLTSEGIFVNSLTAVNVGDKVRVTGTVAENALTPSFNQAVITPITAADLSVLEIGQQALVTPTVLDLPLTTLGDLERYEGMLITIPETLTVTEVFNLGRFGEVSLSADGRLFNPTNIIDPNDAVAAGTNSTGTSNVAAVTAQQNLNDRRRILLDDGSSLSNLSDVPYIDTTDANPANDTLRIGSTIGGLTGVLGFGFNSYRIQPTQAPVFSYEPRPALPDVGGGIKVGSFNVLNYFNGDGAGGGFPTSRGANTALEFSRQRDKIISAIKDLNADMPNI